MNQEAFYRTLVIHNPFNAPVYHTETVSTTMAVSRSLALQGESHGTVIVADFQEQGRGRISRRLWETERGDGLLFTVLLRYPRIEDIPRALTLRTGLAVALAIEDFAPSLSGKVKIKWPNDIMLPLAQTAGKVAGILTEADGGTVYIGIGINVAQKEFPDHLRGKATSIYIAGADGGGDRFLLLEKILARLYNEVMPDDSWKNRIEARLYKKGELVNFADSVADSGKTVTGILCGLGPGGELQISVDGVLHSFIVGELSY